MPESANQNFANHRRWVPRYHFVLAMLLLLNVGHSISMMVQTFSFGQVINFTTAVALVIILLTALGNA